MYSFHKCSKKLWWYAYYYLYKLEDFDDEEFERPKEEAKIVDDELVVEDDIGEIKQPPVQEPKKTVNTKSSTGLPPRI